MDAREYLSQIRRLDSMINQKQHELDDLRARATSTGSFDYSKDRVQSSLPDGAGFERDVMRIVELEDEIGKEIDRFAAVRHKIIGEIQTMPDRRYAELLFMRYVEYKRFEEIAVEMRYSFDRVRHLHKDALMDFESRHTIAHFSVV